MSLFYQSIITVAGDVFYVIRRFIDYSRTGAGYSKITYERSLRAVKST